MMNHTLLCLLLTLLGAQALRAVDPSPIQAVPNKASDSNSASRVDPSPAPLAPLTLPGNGLAQHSFLYSGEWDFRKPVQTLFVVRDGKVAWTYDIPTKDEHGNLQELGDATMLSNGNILFCRKIGASEITPDKKIVWNIDAPEGSEIHCVQPIGLDRVLVMQNGNPAKLILFIAAVERLDLQFVE